MFAYETPYVLLLTYLAFVTLAVSWPNTSPSLKKSIFSYNDAIERKSRSVCSYSRANGGDKDTTTKWGAYEHTTQGRTLSLPLSQGGLVMKVTMGNWRRWGAASFANIRDAEMSKLPQRDPRCVTNDRMSPDNSSTEKYERLEFHLWLWRTCLW